MVRRFSYSARCSETLWSMLKMNAARSYPFAQVVVFQGIFKLRADLPGHSIRTSFDSGIAADSPMEALCRQP